MHHDTIRFTNGIKSVMQIGLFVSSKILLKITENSCWFEMPFTKENKRKDERVF